MTENHQKGEETTEDKDLDEFTEELKNGDKTAPPTQLKEEEKNKYKVIDIDWDRIPYIFALKEKMKKALELDLEHVPGEASFIVKNGAGSHIVTENSCDCEDWRNRGTSIDPCKHMIRVKFSDAELMKMLDKASLEKIINGKAKKMQKPKEIQKAEQQEIAMMEHEEEILDIPEILPALAEIGKIKMGGHISHSGFQIPEKWDHFKIGSMLKDEKGEVIIDRELTDLIGEHCTEIDISLCYDVPILNIPNFYAFFTASKLQCRGNGKRAYRRNEKGGLDEIICNRKNCQFAKDKKCKPYAKLSMILEKANRVGGIFVLRTTSFNTIRNLKSAMAYISNSTGGILAGLPLKLRLMPATVMPNGLNKRVTVYVANIEYDGTLTELKEEGLRELKRRQDLGVDMKDVVKTQQKLIVKQAIAEAEEEAAEIAGEFYEEGGDEE